MIPFLASGPGANGGDHRLRGTRYTSSQSLAFDAGLRVCEAEARVRELDG